MLPAILRGVDDSAWRTKQGSIELLGTMAYLAPKQLSTSLPTVVPILGKTLSDPHPKVQASAKKALEEVRLALHQIGKHWIGMVAYTCTNGQDAGGSTPRSKLLLKEQKFWMGQGFGWHCLNVTLIYPCHAGRRTWSHVPLMCPSES